MYVYIPFTFTIPSLVFTMATSVQYAMAVCGLDDDDLFQGQTDAQRVANRLFNDDFYMASNASDEELDAGFKYFRDLTVANGRLIIDPITRKKIKAFVQWTKDKVREGIDPTSQPFVLGDYELIKLTNRIEIHKAYMADVKTMSATTKPIEFTNEVKWMDWYPTLVSH